MKAQNEGKVDTVTSIKPIIDFQQNDEKTFRAKSKTCTLLFNLFGVTEEVLKYDKARYLVKHCGFPSDKDNYQNLFQTITTMQSDKESILMLELRNIKQNILNPLNSKMSIVKIMQQLKWIKALQKEFR